MGGLPSSRLTRILQEKAEALKKHRQSADAAIREVDERVRLLESIGLVLPESKERGAALQALARKTDWEGAETQAKSFLEYLAKTGQEPFETRRREIADRAQRLAGYGIPVPDGYAASVAAAQAPPDGGDWLAGVGPLAALNALATSVEEEYKKTVRSKGRALAAWTGASPETIAVLDEHLDAALQRIGEGDLGDGLARVSAALATDLPAATERHDRIRADARAILAAAQDLGVSSDPIEPTLAADQAASPLEWPTTAEAVAQAGTQVAETLREKVVATIDSLRATIESLRPYGVDPSEALVALQNAAGAVPTAAPSEIPRILAEARSTTEEPVVAIVASLLDGVRPRLVETRRLGRDPSEVFAAMNRAREALRLRIYSEALAASQEAIDRVNGLTQDLDGARGEADSLRDLLGRLGATGFPTAPFNERLERIEALLARVELEPARELLRETLHTLGGESVQFFAERFAAIEQLLPIAEERGFLPAGAVEDVARARRFLDEGQLAEAGELLGSFEVRLRTGAGPYMARRVEELSKGFEDIPDESLVAPVRRLLADADVNLRVKEDLAAALDSLRRAEREFTSVFAAHASALVEILEEERRTLESMGGAGDEIQRQIDEVQQIFNMGDFVKASRASQEIRTRAHHQQLIRSEDAYSHAKLALVELAQMGVEPEDARGTLERAADAAHEQRYADAYRFATESQETAVRLKAKAQSILDGLQEANALAQELARAGVSVEVHREKIRLVQAAYRALDFEGARDGLDVVNALLKSEQANAETRRLLSEGALLREDAVKLGLPTDAAAGRLAEAEAALTEGRSVEALQSARQLHVELIDTIRPVLSEHLRSLERDLEVARAGDLEIAPVVELLGEARRRLALPVPVGVAELAETARSRLIETRGFLEHAERALKRASDALNEADLVHVGGPTARERLGAIERALKGREYARSVDLATALEREMLQLTYQHVSKSLAGLQGLLVRSRHDGTETSVAENLLTQARQALEEGRPLEALQTAARSEAELERVELQVRIAQGSLKTMEQKLGAADQDGVRAKVAREKFSEAEAAFRDRLFPIVLELAIDASDSLGVARENFRRSRDALDSADRQVKEGMEFGADVTDVVGVLDAARSAHQAGEYGDAVRKARDAAERARWAVERLYAGALSDVRHLIETARTAGLGDELARVNRTVEEVEAALTSREWKRATDLLQKARDGTNEALTARLEVRLAEVQALHRTDRNPSEAEVELRTQAIARFTDERARGAYPQALETLRVEEARTRDMRRGALQTRVAALRDRLWIGEKLGLDTTPVMELFSEAQIALQSGQLEPVPDLLQRGEAKLKELVRARIDDKLKETQTELVFASEGLHVALADVVARLEGVPGLVRSGSVIEAAQLVLESSEELNRRKALHRELLNLHYLIDAALGRAAERHLDTAEARRLLDESIHDRATDYGAALEKARAALKLLQGQLQGVEAQATPGFWPFRRPPGPTPT